MTRNLKGLGLALVSLLAMCAMAAPGASASQNIFHSDAEETVLLGTSESDDIQEFHRGATTLSCTHAEFIGTEVGTTDSTIELEADYTTGTCHGPLNSEVHVDFTTGECGYHFTGTASGTAVPSLFCNAPGGSVTLTPTAFGSSLCTIHVPAQNDLGGHVIVSNDGGDLTASATVTGIDSTRTGSSLCGPASHLAGEYTGDVEIEGEDHDGNPVDLEVT